MTAFLQLVSALVGIPEWLLRHGNRFPPRSGTQVTSLAAAAVKYGAMNPPNDRRTVPRHLRDGEHDMADEHGGFAERAADAPRPGRAWFAIVMVVAAALAAWIWFG